MPTRYTGPPIVPRCYGYSHDCDNKVAFRLAISYAGARAFPSHFDLCGVCVLDLVVWLTDLESRHPVGSVLWTVRSIGRREPL